VTIGRSIFLIDHSNFSGRTRFENQLDRLDVSGLLEAGQITRSAVAQPLTLRCGDHEGFLRPRGRRVFLKPSSMRAGQSIQHRTRSVFLQHPDDLFFIVVGR